MPSSQLLVVASLVATAILACLLSLYLFERRQGSKSALYMALLMAACGWWAILNALEYIALGLPLKLLLADLEYLSIASIPVLWFSFGSSFNREERKGTGRDPVPGVWIVPALTAMLVWLDPSLGLVRGSFRLEEQAGFVMIAKDYGPWFWVHSAYSYLLIVAGTVLILRGLGSGRGTGRNQLGILVFGTLLPVAANVLYITGLFPLRTVDPTPLAFSMSGLLLVLNLGRFRFLSLVGAAQSAAIEQLRDAVLVLDGRGKLAYANRAAKLSFALGSMDIGKRTTELGPPLSELSPLQSANEEVASNGRLFETHRGEILRDGRSIGHVLTLIDVTRRVLAENGLKDANRDLEEKITQRTLALEESALRLSEELEHRTRSERQLHHDALHDPLTGLANRSLVSSRIEQCIMRHRRDGTAAYGILTLDFNGFKSVNDNFGHDAGDSFLREVSSRLKNCVREIDTVARIGGDEFVVLLESVGGAGHVREVVDRLVEGLSVPLALGGNVVVPSVSIGILEGRPEYRVPEEPLRDAGIAMHIAKASGKNGRVVFEEEMRLRYTTQNRMLSDLRDAISSGGIALAFQPIVRMDGAPVGCEVLARWCHAEFGPIGPDRFIPLAESSGLIVPLGTLVLIETLKIAAGIAESGRLPGIDRESGFFFSVNVSAIQLGQPGFTDLILDSIDRFSLPHSMIHLEITESVIMENLETIFDAVERLVAAGISFKLDDFGTGYSSLGYLHRIPIDSVKIDRSFIERMGEAGAAASDGLVHGIISLAHELGKTVVAEGIETAGQAGMLRDFGCDYGQGYYFGKPMDMASLTRSLSESRDST